MTIARYFWIFAIFTPTFAASQTTAPDRAVITQCLDHDKKGDKCIGIITDVCIAKIEATDENLQACAGRELAVWDEFLQAYKTDSAPRSCLLLKERS